MANMNLTLGTGFKASLARLISVTDSGLGAELRGISGASPQQGESVVDLVDAGYVRCENFDIKAVLIVGEQQGATVYDIARSIYYLEGDSIPPERYNDVSAVLISVDFVEVADVKIGFRFTDANIYVTLNGVTYEVCSQNYTDPSTPLVVDPGLSLKLKFLIQL